MSSCCEELGPSIVDNVLRVLFSFLAAVNHVLLFFRSFLCVV